MDENGQVYFGSEDEIPEVDRSRYDHSLYDLLLYDLLRDEMEELQTFRKSAPCP
jgi:hypothetical protein